MRIRVPYFTCGLHLLPPSRLQSCARVFLINIGFCLQLFRELLLSEGFQEIHSPKLLGGASEGGASCFRLDYMGRPACLAQSPQFYKQMALCADFNRVFEIGPVFRWA